MNAPRSWPKSSLSMSSRGIAAQLTVTNGASLRERQAVDGAATSSLPVPLSPVMSTLALVGATLSISWKSRCIGALCADHLVARFELLAQHPAIAADASAVRIAFFTLTRTRSRFERLLEEVARAELDRGDRVVHRRVSADDDDRHLAASLRPCASRSSASRPLISGSFTSKMARSTGVCGLARISSACSAALGFDDVVAFAARARARSVRRMFFSSSTTSTRGGVGRASATAFSRVSTGVVA